MLYNFDTHDERRATAALIIYVVWRSRSRNLKITPKIWGQVEQWSQASAKRSRTLGEFLQRLKESALDARALNPKWMEVGIKGMQGITNSAGTTEYVEREDQREFLTAVLKSADDQSVLSTIYKETALVVLYVRERLEREKPFEKQLTGIANESEN